MAKDLKGEIVTAKRPLDYAPLDAHSAEQLQTAAERIRQTVKRGSPSAS